MAATAAFFQPLAFLATVSLALWAVIYMVNHLGDETTPSTTRKKAATTLEMGGSDEKETARGLQDIEMKEVKQFKSLEDDLRDINREEDDLEQLRVQLTEYRQAITSLREQLSRRVHHANLNDVNDKITLVLSLSKILESVHRLNHRAGGLEHIEQYFKRLMQEEEKKLEDAKKAEKNLREQLEDEIAKAEEGLEELQEDREDEKGSDDIGEDDREREGIADLKKIKESNETSLQLIEKVQDKIEVAENKAEKILGVLGSNNDGAAQDRPTLDELQHDMADKISDIKDRINTFNRKRREIQESDKNPRQVDEFQDAVNDVIKELYEEKSSLVDIVHGMTAEKETALTELWDDVIATIRTINTTKQEYNDVMNDLVQEINHEIEIHHVE